MTVEIQLTCTDRGTHTRAELDTVRVEEDGSFDTVRARIALAPWQEVPGARIIVEGESHLAPRRVLKKAARRSDFEERRRWRWKCERCGRDTPLDEKALQSIVDYCMANDRRFADLSWRA